MYDKDHLEDSLLQPVLLAASTIDDGNQNILIHDLKTSRISNKQNSTTGVSDDNGNTKNSSHKNNFNLQQQNRNQTLSICLLLKDDNDIIQEWIAYHYHTFTLRHLVVAIDPYSETSPSSLFDLWRSEPFNIQIEEWTDKDYMPGFFMDGKYDEVPSFLPTSNNNSLASKWDKADLVHINNHRFRQVTFVSSCYQHLKAKGRTWAAHIDTDEYIVINPNIIVRPKSVQKTSDKFVHIPSIPAQGSVMSFLEDMFTYYPKRLSRKCIMMPSLLFGSIEDNDSNQKSLSDHWNVTKFETLRWKYHANHTDIINGLQKSIVDVSRFGLDHPVFESKRIFSVHQPLEYPDCRRYTIWPDVNAVRLYPLMVNHYLGSLQRYLSRTDKRRNIEIYNSKAQVGSASYNSTDGSQWIQGWLTSFEQEHAGATDVVMKEYMDDINSW